MATYTLIFSIRLNTQCLFALLRLRTCPSPAPNAAPAPSQRPAPPLPLASAAPQPPPLALWPAPPQPHRPWLEPAPLPLPDAAARYPILSAASARPHPQRHRHPVPLPYRAPSHFLSLSLNPENRHRSATKATPSPRSGRLHLMLSTPSAAEPRSPFGACRVLEVLSSSMELVYLLYKVDITYHSSVATSPSCSSDDVLKRSVSIFWSQDQFL